MSKRDIIQQMLGMLQDEKRIYRIQEGEVAREEFEYCQIIDQVVFGEKGYVETLGPTWNLIHDPRFVKIENAFIVNRRSTFGGDARIGKQYISSEGQFSSTVADLEQYSEILGEGRHFHNCLTHPNAGECPVRKWLERTHTKTYVLPRRDLAEMCKCDPNTKLDPHVLKDMSDDFLWALIKSECPNYFTKDGKPNLMATRLFDLFRADLVGLIADYAVTPLVDEWVLLETGDLVEENAQNAEWADNPPRVFLEVDLLEKALTYRATLRATAAKILKNIGFSKQLEALTGNGELELTDIERDEMLRMVYASDWPDGRADLITKLTNFVASTIQIPFDVREREQLAVASEESKTTVAGLMAGTIDSINHYTEPAAEVGQDEHAAIVESIMKNPYKQELFLEYADAEKRNEKAVVEILAPVFLSPNYELGPTAYQQLKDRIQQARSRKQVISFEEEFHTADGYIRGWEQPVDTQTGEKLTETPERNMTPADGTVEFWEKATEIDDKADGASNESV
jgi:hypothetical protein